MVLQRQTFHLGMNLIYLGLVRGPHVQRLDRVADSHVPVHAHNRQGEGAGEHVVVVDRHNCLAKGIPKWPEAQIHISALETFIDQRRTT